MLSFLSSEKHVPHEKAEEYNIIDELLGDDGEKRESKQ